MRAAIILGAGFSKNSGLPLESEVTKKLIEPGKSTFDSCAAFILRKFMRDIFGYNESKNFPGLDDIFNCIDISTNSGHHLGLEYSPIHLRGIRRLLIYRLFTLLEEEQENNTHVMELLKTLYNTYEVRGFVVLNWDTVLERYVKGLFPGIEVDYCSRISPIEEKAGSYCGKAVIAKVHGSCSWLYCDNCRELYHDLNSPVGPLRKAGLHITDLLVFDGLREALGENGIPSCTCPVCGDVLASHIATMSYRKTFKANTFPDIWAKAEKILSESERWIFIGYSLPGADYEFKHMLKLAEIKTAFWEKGHPGIDVILKSRVSVPAYESFFGKSINRIYTNGINSYH